MRADIRAFFDEVEHPRVLAAFARTVQDDALTRLVAGWLLAGSASSGSGRRVAGSRSAWPPLPDARIAAPLAALAAGGWAGQDMATPALTWAGRRLAAAAAGRPPHTLLAALGAGAALAGTAAVVAGRHSRRAGVLRGTPQGAPLSPLLATGMLAPLDRALDHPSRVLVRYVDDLLLVCRDEATARRGLAELHRQVQRLGLALNDAKTLVQPYDAGFRFLGQMLPRRGLAAARPIPAALVEAFARSPYGRRPGPESAPFQRETADAGGGA